MVLKYFSSTHSFKVKTKKFNKKIISEIFKQIIREMISIIFYKPSSYPF